MNRDDLLMIDASVFKLTKRCFSIAFNDSFKATEERLSVFDSCVAEFVSARSFLRAKVTEDLGRTIDSNEKRYADFY